MDRIAQLLERYDRPGPRYTSYPTAVEFHEGFGPAAFRERLRAAARAASDPLSLYVHIPFCSSRCACCGCNAIVTSRRDVADRYIDDLLGEARILAGLLGSRLRVVQYHWGGGTPTYLDVERMRRLFAGLGEILRIDPAGEIAVEIHPSVTTREQIDALLDLGFNRLSMGVQDFAPEVQEAIGRNQGEEETVGIYRYARERGFGSINFDLIYGLPKQTEQGFRATLERVIALRPDRLAVYSYAHVPWLRPHQKRILPEWLPPREVKLALFALARSMLAGAGYEAIGMDHFALPDDELARAVRARRLWRNFMGYTVKAAPDMIGLGISSISDVAGAFAQTTKKLSVYHRAVDAGELATERGLALSDD
ncbi:MAG: oxygen-independent coproporphyrinogen III oxidase, partial [Planctomycetes bacterium]|nr:oxygen-independent coproporphyrinogen III oxidase [Planctomycetota bacterium]